MLLATTETICGKTIVRHLGLVRGNTIRARNIGRDIMAKLRNVVGGEITDYTKLMGESREQAIDRLLLAGAKIDPLKGWEIPELPLKGGEIVARGVNAGPEVARILQAVETRWVAEGFPSRVRVEEMLAEELAGA